MEMDPRKARKKAEKAEKALEKELRKDQLIQTRVDRRLQKMLIDQARSRRISVSNLVRNILEDAVGLGVSPLASEAGPPPTKPAPALDHIYAWNSVILGRAAACSRCARALEGGSHALMGLSEDPAAPRAWLCLQCGEEL
jgi:hypothetical protein